jgi:hypothetical protein
MCDGDGETIDLGLERVRAFVRQVGPRVSALESEVIGLAKLRPRARQAPHVFVTVRQIEQDAHASCDALALGELWASLRVST